MKKNFSFFKVRFAAGLQYRMASFAALTTQFVWGLMECLAYRALMESNAAAFPMEYAAVVSYIWLKEAFFVLFGVLAMDNDIFNLIIDGGIAYELCRPVSVYSMWFSRIVAGRTSNVALRCGFVLLGAVLMPAPFRISAPVSAEAFVLFLVTMVLGLGVTVAYCMMVYILCFFTISPQGWRTVFMGAIELLSGSLLPLPFIPEPFRSVLELLPFASMQNVPFRIYSGDLTGKEMMHSIGLQMFWLVVLICLGNWLCKRAVRRVVVQGG